ncbi:MAG TPA: LptA/OstA family protein, partial [Tepidisphaeraceae bacterium]
IDARCSDLSYHTADSSAVLTGKVELSQTKGGVVSSVTGESLNFSRATHLALFDGPGRIRLPDPNDAKSVMTADYGRSCRVHFFDVDSSQMQVERADLAGNVVVDHPRFHLTAINNVGLQFDAVSGAAAQKSSSPALRRITAIGNADCVVHEANKKDRRIAGQQLQLLRDPGPDGTLYAKTIICDGSVKAIQDDQMLSAEHLQIGLLPTRGKTNGKSEDEVALDTLTASTNVVITGNDSYASADQLYVKMLDGHAHVTLYGLPGQNAKVRDKSSTMTGPMIHLSPHDQTASIEGAGSFAGLEQPKDPRQKPRPLVLTWLKKATLNGNTNEAFVVGEVSALSDEPGGSRDSAKCDYILATLVDVPATKPTGAPAANKPGDANGYGADADFMKNKQIDVLSLRMDDASAAAATTRPSAEMQSYLTDAGGYLLHQYNLLSKQIDYEVPSKRLIVPGPGEIFAREQAPRGDAAAGDAGSGIGGHGSTAIQWHKRFIFDDAEHTAVIDGGVTIVHVTDGKKPEQTRLDNADIVQAKFATGETQAGQANSGDGDNSQVRQLKSLTATGKMIVRTTDKTIYCGEFDFDPSEQTLTCRGGVLGKVTVVDDNNLAGGTCAQAVFNLKTNELKKMTDVTGQER